MNGARLVLVLAVAGVWLWSAPARAWTCVDDGCPAHCEMPVQYRIGALPAGLDEAAVIAEIQRAAAVWSAPDCSGLELEYAGRVEEGADPPPITVEWLEAWPHPSSAITVSAPMWSTEGCITSATIEANAADYTWVLDPGEASGSNVHLFTLMASAFGRALGVGNTDVRGSLVYFAYDGPLTGPSADDVAGICNLYTADGIVCSDTEPCPAELACEGGVCVPDLPTAPDAGMPPPAPDAGPAPSDAGALVDSSPPPMDGGGGGGGCAVSPGERSPVGGGLWAASFLALLARRRR